jgi:hypothetical protein
LIFDHRSDVLAIVSGMDSGLGRAYELLEQHGVIPAMCKVIAEVYVRNAARHDPVLGDDATTFGITTSRNVANLAMRRLSDLDGVRARLIDTALEVSCGGYVIRQYKLPGATREVSVDLISWDDSDAKLDGAIENSAAGQLALDRDWEPGREAFGHVVPPMRHLRLAHAGDLETGECVIYLGFPRDDRDGGLPWYDVAVVHGELGGTDVEGSGPGRVDAMVPRSGPRYDELPLPDVDLAPRSAPRQEDAGSGAKP